MYLISEARFHYLTKRAFKSFEKDGIIDGGKGGVTIYQIMDKLNELIGRSDWVVVADE